MADWHRLGDRAIRLKRPRAGPPHAIVHAVRAWPGVIDVVVTHDEIGVYFDADPRVDPRLLEGLDRITGIVEPTRALTLHAIYDGPDLDDVARACSMTVEDVIDAHAAATYLVETMGFAPGFAYLSGLDQRFRPVVRRATPRTRVPAGSLAIAGGYCAVYPFDSPGGWNVIGCVQERMFGSEGSLLHLGDRVRFVR